MLDTVDTKYTVDTTATSAVFIWKDDQANLEMKLLLLHYYCSCHVRM